MPRCPSCNQVYQDTTQRYCLNDGTRLVSDQGSYDPQKTLVAPPPRDTADPPLKPTQYVPPAGQWPPAGQQPPQWAPPPQQWGGYYQQPGPYAPATPRYAQPGQPITAVLSLVFGIMSALLSLFGFPISWLSFVFGVPGVVLAIVALNHVTSKGVAMTGVAASAFGLIVFFIRLFVS